MQKHPNPRKKSPAAAPDQAGAATPFDAREAIDALRTRLEALEARTAETPPAPDVAERIAARSFIVVGADGRTYAELHVNDEVGGTPSLAFFDRKGIRMDVGMYEPRMGEPWACGLSLTDADSHERLRVEVAPDGTPSVFTCEKDGKASWSIPPTDATMAAEPPAPPAPSHPGWHVALRAVVDGVTEEERIQADEADASALRAALCALSNKAEDLMSQVAFLLGLGTGGVWPGEVAALLLALQSVILGETPVGRVVESLDKWEKMVKS